MPSVTARAAAKINLFLAIGRPRRDGFHDLATVFHAVSLHDDVTASTASGLRVTIATETGVNAEEVPTDSSNLAARAAMALAKRVRRRPDVHLHIRKGIPVAGGMAGGSADAAAALIACDALWGTGLTRAALYEMAAQLGSDVSFALLGGTAIGRGRGETLSPALARGRFEWVLALADEGLSTPEVYAELDRLREGRVLPEPAVSDAVMSALRAGNAVALGKALCNDLQAAACTLRPQLLQTLEVGATCGALGSIVSGSGPTVAFLTRDAEHSLDIAVALGASGACSFVKRAQGPAAGVRVIEAA
jgi:4-diphosphocytidyl-2-C-methyl-D-erythritol kinase